MSVGIIMTLVISSHLTTGFKILSHKPDVKNHHQSFELIQPNLWQDRLLEWHHPQEYRPARTMAYWRLHDWHPNPENHHYKGNPGSWPSRDPESWDRDKNNWFNQEAGWQHDMPSEWHHFKPNQWDHNKPNDWHYQKPGHWGNHEPTDLQSQVTTHWQHQKPNEYNMNNKEITETKYTTQRGNTASSSEASPRQGELSPLAIAFCIRNCPVTSEYNPVCGSNNITYGNPGRLECAKDCGVDVTLDRLSSCAVAASTTPQIDNSGTTYQYSTEPSQIFLPVSIKPTRFTTIDVAEQTDTPADTPSFTIPAAILDSIFTTTPATVDDNYDIDIRTRNQFVAQHVYPIPSKKM